MGYPFSLPIEQPNFICQVINCRCFVKSAIVNIRYAIRYDDFFDVRQLIKCVTVYNGNITIDGNLFQRFRHIGGICLPTACSENVAEPSDFIVLIGRADERQGDFLQRCAILKRAKADDELLCVGIRDGHLDKCRAEEGVIVDVDDAFWHGQLGHARVGKGVGIKALDFACLGNGQLFQIGATVEGVIRNFHNAVRHRDVREIDTPIERALVNALEL